LVKDVYAEVYVVIVFFNKKVFIFWKKVVVIKQYSENNWMGFKIWSFKLLSFNIVKVQKLLL